MALHGGKRVGAGRKAGARNKATDEQLGSITEMAQRHTADAMKALVEILKDASSPPSARVAAANAILDRGYGKPVQGIDHKSTDGTMSPKRASDAVMAALARKHDAG